MESQTGKESMINLMKLNFFLFSFFVCMQLTDALADIKRVSLQLDEARFTLFNLDPENEDFEKMVQQNRYFFIKQ